MTYVRGHRVVVQVDVYSFGLIMWSLWTRQEPWAGMDTRDLAMRVLAGEDPRPPLPGVWLAACGGRLQPRRRCMWHTPRTLPPSSAVPPDEGAVQDDVPWVRCA